MTGTEAEKIIPVAESFDGIYCDGLYGIKLAEQLNKPFFAGFGLNLSNNIDISLCNAEYIALSKELTLEEAQPLSTQSAFFLTAGNIKVMDLIYCPFGKKCKSCDKRNVYTLTDENGRKFPLRRYKIDGNCRFEVYNCANLVSSQNFCGALFDFSLEENAAVPLAMRGNTEKLKAHYNGNFTRGHTVKPVL